MLPCRRVGVGLVESGVGGHQGAGGLVGVVVVAAVFADGGTPDAALACAVDAGKHVEARRCWVCHAHGRAAEVSAGDCRGRP